MSGDRVAQHVVKRFLGLLAASTLLAACGAEPPAARVTPSPVSTATQPPTPTPAVATIVQLLDRCPTSAELASVNASLSMTFTSDPTAGQLVCTAAEGSRDLTLLQERAYQAVLMFTWIRFDAPLPWTDLTLDQWFAKAIHGVAFANDYQDSYCCLPGAVIAIQSKNLAVLSTTLAPWDSVRWLAALYVHEARHNEGYTHTCTTGDRAGVNDNTIAELGAWGVEYYFTLWLGTHSDPRVVPEELRPAVRAEATSFVPRFFCKEPATSPTP